MASCDAQIKLVFGVSDIAAKQAAIAGLSAFDVLIKIKLGRLGEVEDLMGPAPQPRLPSVLCAL